MRVRIHITHNFQPDTSVHCEKTDTGLVHRAVYLVMSQLSQVLGILRLLVEEWPN